MVLIHDDIDSESSSSRPNPICETCCNSENSLSAKLAHIHNPREYLRHLGPLSFRSERKTMWSLDYYYFVVVVVCFCCFCCCCCCCCWVPNNNRIDNDEDCVVGYFSCWTFIVGLASLDSIECRYSFAIVWKVPASLETLKR
jgi:hypothetical protein